MKLVELDPRWLLHNGQRVGFTFISPKYERRTRHDGSVDPTIWRQSCFAAPTPHKLQDELLEREFGEDHTVQRCNPTSAWTIAGGIDAANFETMTVTPSLDGSAGGLWHGFITNGEIR